MNGEVLSGCEVVPYRDGWPPAPGFIVGFLLSPHGPKLLKTWVAVECSLLSAVCISAHRFPGFSGADHFDATADHFATVAGLTVADGQPPVTRV